MAGIVNDLNLRTMQRIIIASILQKLNQTQRELK